MTRCPRRNHTPVFKSKVALAVVPEERILGELAQQFDVHPNQIKQWRDKLLADVGDIFSGETKPPSTDTPVEVKTLHAKIGELTLENDFLEGALTKAGLLSAKR